MKHRYVNIANAVLFAENWNFTRHAVYMMSGIAYSYQINEALIYFYQTLQFASALSLHREKIHVSVTFSV